MATNVPVTKWRPADGGAEAGQSDSANITTLSGLKFVTLSGLYLIIAPGTITPTPVTEWAEDDSQ